MNNNKFNEQRHNRQKQFCRFILGFQQLVNHPLINLVWLLFAGGIIALLIARSKLISLYDANPLLNKLFEVCMNVMAIAFSVICAIGLIQFVGFISAIRDEADMSIVFGDKRDVKNQPPILRYKKTDRKSGVTKREFYSAIPMERWQEKKEAICDRMDIHIIGDITYGGRHRNIGNRIIIESAKGRKFKDRGALYDDTF
ncbi:MAG: hypothetical protein MJ105_09600 [Lachnospiraceae bacterium]|nr:hypothetical protein [Lachnospiraceae bacterium]